MLKIEIMIVVYLINFFDMTSCLFPLLSWGGAGRRGGATETGSSSHGATIFRHEKQTRGGPQFARLC